MHSRGVGSKGGAVGCWVSLLLATKRSGMGRNAQPFDMRLTGMCIVSLMQLYWFVFELDTFVVCV